MNFLQVSQPIPDIRPETIFSIAGFPVTNTMLLVWLIIVVLVCFSVFLKKRIELKPVKKVQVVAEIIVEKSTEMINQITRNEQLTKKLLPLIGAIFVFFLVSNIIALIPGIGALTAGGKTLLRAPTTDLNTTLAVAITVVFLMQLFGVKNRGILGHLGQYFQFKQVYQGFKQGIGKGVISVINFAMGLLDIVGDMAKVISLSLRLFGNMFAGEVLIIVMMSFFAFIAPSLLIAQTILIGILQALVFSILSAVYISLTVDNKQEQ